LSYPEGSHQFVPHQHPQWKIHDYVQRPMMLVAMPLTLQLAWMHVFADALDADAVLHSLLLLLMMKLLDLQLLLSCNGYFFLHLQNLGLGAKGKNC
jgi:uncharacterized membrane protein